MNNHLSFPIRGIIFDLDGTLYDMSWFMKPLFFARLFPTSMRLPRYLHIRETFAGREMETRQRLIDALSEEVSRREGSSREEIRVWINDVFYPAFVAIMPFFRRSRPGLVRLLTSLKSKGCKLGVLSDFDYVKERLEKLSLSPSLFDAISSSEAAGALKPHHRPYGAMAEEWGVASRNILVVGDRVDTDGDAARVAGMQFLLIEDGRRCGHGVRWKELADLLSKIDIQK